ncbi:hypothetical protein HK096_010556 [Nowakowskiella sp. JEL0078]|nr:hypothetical protein HK096_010556 [Nowakowskiella sp. JEL0078]
MSDNDMDNLMKMLQGLEKQWGSMQDILANDGNASASATRLPGSVPPQGTVPQSVPPQSVPPQYNTVQSPYPDTSVSRSTLSPDGSIQRQSTTSSYNAPPLPDKSQLEVYNPTIPSALPAYSAPSGSRQAEPEGNALLIKRMQALAQLNIVKTDEIKKFRTAIDIAFILDLTRSMDPWLDVTRLKIRQITQELAVKYPDSIARFSFVGYKDFDKNTLQPFYVVHDFNTAQAILDKISNLQCDGGDDFCEDVLGAFSQLTSLSWRAKTRLVIFVADAPAHHEYFHDCGPQNDRFHNCPDPAGRGPQTAEELMRFLANSEIEIHAFKIPVMGSSMVNDFKTEKMHMRFREILNRYGSEIFVHQLSEGPETFLPNVLQAVSSSVIRSSMR